MRRKAATKRQVSRVTISIDDQGFIMGIRSDEEVEIYLIYPHVENDKVYLWSSTRTGRHFVDERLDECIVHHPEVRPALLS